MKYKLIRLSTKKEDNSPTAERRAFESFDDLSIVYMPYGPEGRGFYKPLETKTIGGEKND